MVKYTRGVKRVVGNDAGPTPIPEEIVEGIKARERDGLIVFERYGEEPAIGDEIEVVEGPLKGLKGIFRKEIGDSERVMILLNYVSYQGMLLIEKDKLKKILGPARYFEEHRPISLIHRNRISYVGTLFFCGRLVGRAVRRSGALWPALQPPRVSYPALNGYTAP